MLELNPKTSLLSQDRGKDTPNKVNVQRQMQGELGSLHGTANTSVSLQHNQEVDQEVPWLLF